MNFLNRKYLAVLGAGAMVLGSTAAAVGAGVSIPVVNPTNGDPSFEQQVAPVSSSAVSALGVLGDSSKSVDVSTEQKLRDRLGSDTPSTTLAAADFARAKAIVASGTKAFLIPSGEKICLILPSEGDVLGGTCSSLEAVKSGDAFVLTPLPSGQTSVVALVADGQPGPTIVADNGQKSHLKVTDNVAAGLADSGGSLVTSTESVPLNPKPATLVK